MKSFQTEGQPVLLKTDGGMQIHRNKQEQGILHSSA